MSLIEESRIKKFRNVEKRIEEKNNSNGFKNKGFLLTLINLITLEIKANTKTISKELMINPGKGIIFGRNSVFRKCRKFDEIRIIKINPNIGNRKKIKPTYKAIVKPKKTIS